MKRLQNKVAGSRFSLPFSAVYAAVILSMTGMSAWVAWTLFALTVLVMLELNNSHALIRIFSQTVSCSFLLLSLADPMSLCSPEGNLTALLPAAFYAFLFRAYQDRSATGWVYYAFTLLGLLCMLHVQAVFFIPVVWILLFSNVMAGSLHTFAASLLGLVTPLWFVTGYHLYKGTAAGLWNTVCSLTLIQEPFAYETLTPREWTVFALTALAALTGTIHFLRTSYKDKIRTRMFYEIFITMELCATLLLLLQPQCHELALRLMTVNAAPLIAHFVALTSTRITNIAFLLLVLLSIATSMLNLWMPW